MMWSGISYFTPRNFFAQKRNQLKTGFGWIWSEFILFMCFKLVKSQVIHLTKNFRYIKKPSYFHSSLDIFIVLNSFTRNAYFLLQGSFGSRIVLHVTFYIAFYLINFSNFSSSVVYTDQLFSAAHSILNILSQYSSLFPKKVHCLGV